MIYVPKIAITRKTNNGFYIGQWVKVHSIKERGVVSCINCGRPDLIAVLFKPEKISEGESPFYFIYEELTPLPQQLELGSRVRRVDYFLDKIGQVTRFGFNPENMPNYPPSVFVLFEGAEADVPIDIRQLELI